jgi:hypothetical protein
MSATSLFYANEKHPKTQPHRMDFTFQITAAKTVVSYPVGADVYPAFDALTQAVIDRYLGSTNEFLATLFDATSMGADAFGGLINMKGQAASVVRMEAKCYSGTGNATLVARAAIGSAGLTASTLETAVGVSSSGNIGFKVDFGNTPDFDALTSGIIIVSVWWISK